ncbi:hypothetical protein GAT98_16955 [Salmonella enterica]|nr:hypothetical protein [Salmonella enterica]
MKTAEAAKGRWPEILEHFDLPPITGKNHYRGECPVCGARGKFRIDDRDGAGTWICVCGSGDVKRGELFKIDLQLIQDNQKRHNGELFKIKFAVV